MVAAERERHETQHLYICIILYETEAAGRMMLLTAILLITHVAAVVVTVTLPDAADALPVSAAVLVWQAGVL